MGTYTKYLNTIQTGGTNVVTSGGSKSYANIISSYQKPKATPTPTTYASPTPTVTLNKPKVLNTVGNFLKTSAEKISKTKPTDYIMGAGQDVVSKSLRQYVSDSFKATSEVVKSLYKITPIYEISQNIKGEKVTPKENLKNSIDLALNTISAIYRTSPAAPVIGAVSGSLKESRQESQRVISILASKEDKRVKATKLLNLPTDASDEQIADATKNYKRNYTGRLLNAAISGVTEQPGVGAVITDNPVAQSIIDVAFMAIMISRPFIKKKLNKLNLKANELAKVSETLEVKPNASMEEISISYKNKVTQYKDVFAGRGTPEQIAQVQKLNDSYNILKKTNVFERVYAGLFGKVNPSDFNVLNEAPLAIREKAGLSTDVKVPTTPEIVKTTPSGEVIKAGEVVKKAEVPSKGYFRYANDVNKTTDNVRGGTWFTNKEGSGVIKDAMNPKNVSEVAIGGDKIFSFSGEPRNPLIVEDVGLLEEGSFAVINNGYENFMQKKYSNAANSLYNKTLNAEKSPSSQEVDKIITDTLSTTGFSTEQIKNVLTLTGKNKLDSAFDLIISTGLKNEGYDSIILKQGNLEHMMYFGKSDVKDLSTQPIKTGEIKPLFDKWVKDYDSGSLKKALEIVEQNPKLREESIKNLPNRMTVYKAIQEGSDTPSWTLDKGLAERWAENGGRELESMKISKSDVGYYLGGPESELFLKNASKEIFDIQPLKTGEVSTPEVKGGLETLNKTPQATKDLEPLNLSTEKLSVIYEKVSNAYDEQMRGGTLEETRTEGLKFKPSEKDNALYNTISTMQSLAIKDPVGFEVARRWDVAAVYDDLYLHNERFETINYDDLPEKISIYRGSQVGTVLTNKPEIFTWDKETAKKFAGKNGVVQEFLINKKDIPISNSNTMLGEAEITIDDPKSKLSLSSPSIPSVKTEIKKRPIAEVKEELSATKTNIEETKAKSKAVAESAQVARAEINTKDVALLKRIYFKSQKFQEGDIETIRNSNTGKLLNNVIENVQEKFPNMSEQEAFDYAMQLPTKASEIPKRSPEIKELSQKLKAIETEYQDYVEKNKLGIGVRKKAIENGIRISMKDLPEYEKVSVDDQAEQALKILVTDPAYALDIALGKVEPPPGLLPESMFNAVEVDALARGDAETLLQLATQSSLVSDATVMGQRLRMLAERNPDSPVSMMKDVIKEKQKALEKKTGKSTSENVKEETAKLKESIDKAKPDKMDWRAFIESIKCK